MQIVVFWCLWVWLADLPASKHCVYGVCVYVCMCVCVCTALPCPPLTKASLTSLADEALTGDTMTSPRVRVECVHMAFSKPLTSTLSRAAAWEAPDSFSK